MALCPISHCSYLHKVLDAWEKRSQEFDVQVKTLSDKICYFDKPDFRATLDGDERRLHDLEIGLKEITKQLLNEISVRRNNLSKNDLEKITKIDAFLGVTMKIYEEIIKMLNQAKGNFSKSTNNPDHTEDEVYRCLQLQKQMKINNLFSERNKEEFELEKLQADVNDAIQLQHDILSSMHSEFPNDIQSIENRLLCEYSPRQKLLEPFHEFLSAWEKRSKELDIQTKILFDKIRVFGTTLDTPEFRLGVNEDEQCLKAFTKNADELMKQLKKEASIHRKNLSESDVDKATKVKSAYNAQSKQAEQTIKEIHKTRKRFPKVNNNSLDKTEIENSTIDGLRRRLRSIQMEINGSKCSIDGESTIQNLKTRIHGWDEMMNNNHSLKSYCIRLDNTVKSNIADRQPPTISRQQLQQTNSSLYPSDRYHTRVKFIIILVIIITIYLIFYSL